MAPARPPAVRTIPGISRLYDLRVEVVGPPDRKIYCGARLGDYFELQGEMLKFPPGQGFSIYSLAALLPLLPAKQRMTDPNDWMSTDADVACPDPNVVRRVFTDHAHGPAALHGHSDVTATSLGGESTLSGEGTPQPRGEAGDSADLTGHAITLISRIIKSGFWHLAGDHGAIEPDQARRDMAAFVEAGITTFDCADIYTGVELLNGSFRQS